MVKAICNYVFDKTDHNGICSFLQITSARLGLQFREGKGIDRRF